MNARDIRTSIGCLRLVGTCMYSNDLVLDPTIRIAIQFDMVALILMTEYSKILESSQIH